jgi:hypothetical protein
MANYIDLGYYLGLRKLAGLRSVTPSIEYMEGTDTVFFVQQDKQIYLTGCEMSALQADCIKISYKANPSNSYTVIKNYVSQTVFNVTNTYDDTNNTNLISVKISATPVMNKRKFGNENSFRYSYQGSTILEEYDTYTGATDNLSITGNAEQDPIGVNNYNFSRSFIFKTPGYYKIELDEAQSALYKTTSTNTILTNPDAQSDYNSYKSSTTGPWTPVDHASHQNGNFFKRQIIVKCVNNYDAILQSNIVTEINEFTGSPPPQTQTVYNPSSADRRKISVKDLLINGQTYGSNQYEKYCIETNGLSTATFNASDKQITTNSSTYKILRNSIFSDIIFNGSGITNLVKIESTGGIITTVDMRNTLFKNCIFKGIVFGSKNYNQLILDGSTFESCEFINCKFYIRPKNILFKNCNINNTGNYAPIFNINGSDGNVFIDLIFNNVDRPFVFDNGDNKNNLNNLFYRVFSTDSPSATNRCSFVKVMQSNSTPGVFVGNIAMMNCIVTVGDPIVIESSASLNLFTMNYFESSGSVKLGTEKNPDADPKNQYYAFISFPNGTQPAEKYLSWENKIIATYSGNLVSTNGGSIVSNGRAFAWEENPVNPITSSPWHNIIYENIFGAYKWGMRSFFLFFPLGGPRASGSSPYANPIEYIKRKNQYSEAAYTAGTYKNTDGTTPDYQCPAIWKGFKESIRSLIEGNMIPTGTGRESITEPCNVTLYLPAFMGYETYREQTTTYWNSLGANKAARDTAFNIKLNDYINDLIYMAGSSTNKNKGKLSICFDTSSHCATPNNIILYQSMTGGGSGVYESDVLELADWNVKTALENAGITVFCEARPSSKNKAVSSTGGYQGTPSPSGTYYDSGWKNFTSIEYWLWVSDPENPTRTNSVNAAERAVWSKHIKNSDANYIFRLPLNGIENYFFTYDEYGNKDLSSDPFGLPSYFANAGMTKTFKNWPGTNLYYSPYFYLHCLYALSDNYRLYNKLKYNATSNASDIKLKTKNYISMPLDIFAKNHSTIWANNNSLSKDAYYIVSDTDPSSSATSGFFNSPEFTLTATQDPSSYAGGFWNKTTGNWSFWNNNIRKKTFLEFIQFLNLFSDSCYPQETIGKSENDIYPNDYWSYNLLKDISLNGLWATPFRTTTNSNLTELISPYIIDGRLFPTIGATKADGLTPLNEAISTPSSAISFFNTEKIPEQRRVLQTKFLDASYGDDFWLMRGNQSGADRQSLDKCFNVNDGCKNSSGNIIQEDKIDPRELVVNGDLAFGGTLAYPSPWFDNTSNRVKSVWTDWLDTYKINFGKVSYIVNDIESYNPLSYWGNFLRQDSADPLGDSLRSRHLNYILNDTRANGGAGNSSIYGSLRSQLKMTGTTPFTVADFNRQDRTKGGYYLWNFVLGRSGAYYANDAVYSPVATKFPKTQVSNYDSIKLLTSDKVPDSNSHFQYKDEDVGNSVAPVLFGEWSNAAGNAIQIDPTDPTSLVDISTGQAFGNTAWKVLLLTQQKLRAVDRNRIADGKKLSVWLAGSGYGSLANYWDENAYHTLLRKPEPILYFNGSGGASPNDTRLINIIKDVNTRTNRKIISTVSSSYNKLNYNKKYIFTGCTTIDKINLWRITIDSNTVQSVSLNGTSYDVRTIPGIWFTTDTSIIDIKEANYDSTTLTLYLYT